MAHLLRTSSTPERLQITNGHGQEGAGFQENKDRPGFPLRPPGPAIGLWDLPDHTAEVSAPHSMGTQKRQKTMRVHAQEPGIDTRVLSPGTPSPGDLVPIRF